MVTYFGMIFVAIEGSNFCKACFSTFKCWSHYPAQVAVNKLVARVLSLVKDLNASDQLFMLISGGGSALMVAPAPDHKGLVDVSVSRATSARRRREDGEKTPPKICAAFVLHVAFKK